MFANLWNSIKLKYFFWQQERQLKKEVNRTVLAVNVLRQQEQDTIKYSYTEGLAQVRKKLGNIRVKKLSEVGDIINFAEKDKNKQIYIDIYFLTV